VLEKWSLFGSSFFAVRRDADPAERSEHILALNRNGVHFLDVITHVNLIWIQQLPFKNSSYLS
jgi:myosin-15